MGRYPIHFHMIGWVLNSYVEGCAIHNTFNRGTTIHGVHHLIVRNNVYYKQMGHCIFIEDSIESKNVIENNLVMDTRVSTSLLSSDLKASAFWITMPDNYIRGNRAVGAQKFGFWFDLPSHPTGPSATTSICPRFTPLLLFENNLAHGNGIGFRIYPFWDPRTFPCSVKYKE